MLVINFNSGNFFGARENSTDIYIGNPDRPRKSNGRPKSNKTHIDLTPGNDLLPGFDPVLDFFPCTAGMAQGEKKNLRPFCLFLICIHWDVRKTLSKLENFSRILL